MYVIGTAGHVDHGKSALVQALTGIDPDRLREEKERGLTIDLGFAWLTLAEGVEVGIVDVPGHERFIKNMLAGVGGIDLALLVIASDEGVMPQTREHLAIIDLLGIEHGVVALTKRDLVDDEFLALARAEVEEEIADTTISGAPIVACSAVTREGLEELLVAISSELTRTPAKRDIERARLPIDRAFTMVGFGTVVTGTLIDGSLKVGDEVEIVPSGRKARIRGLQSHGRKVEVAAPGRRTAANLSGVAVDELRRGMVVTAPGWLRPTDALDVRLRTATYAGRALRHNLSVTVHTGSAEVEGRVLLLDRDEVVPGETTWAQLRLEEPVAVVKGDRFIVRDTNDTLGGGRIVDTHARRHRRHHGPTLASLELMDKGSPEEVVAMAISQLEPVELPELLKKVEVDAAVTRESVERLVSRAEVVAVGSDEQMAKGKGQIDRALLLWSASGFSALTDTLKSVLETYHRQSPLRAGMGREELRNRLRLTQRAFEAAMGEWVQRGEAKEIGGMVALPLHEAALTREQASRADAYLAALRAKPFAPVVESPVEDDLLAYLEAKGEIVRVADGVAFAAEAHAEMVQRVRAHLREKGTVTLAEVRDMLGTSRKYAQALLEDMDERRITRRVGDTRVLR